MRRLPSRSALPSSRRPIRRRSRRAARCSSASARSSPTRGNWISFARYMELALHEPGLGYYAAGARKLGAGGDFVTAPELSPLFGRTLARQVARSCSSRARPCSNSARVAALLRRCCSTSLKDVELPDSRNQRGTRRPPTTGRIGEQGRVDRPSAAAFPRRDARQRSGRRDAGACARVDARGHPRARRVRERGPARVVGPARGRRGSRCCARSRNRDSSFGPLRERARALRARLDALARPVPRARRDPGRSTTASRAREYLPSAALHGHARLPLPPPRARRSVLPARACRTSRRTSISARSRARPREAGLERARLRQPGAVPHQLRHHRPARAREPADPKRYLPGGGRGAEAALARGDGRAVQGAGGRARRDAPAAGIRKRRSHCMRFSLFVFCSWLF